MYSLNRVELIGRLGRDPELKTVGGKSVASFSVATSYGKGDQQKTEWHQVAVWEKLADIAMQVLHKGDNVFIEGRLSYNTVGEGDAKKTYTQITGFGLINLTGKPAGTGTNPATTGTTTTAMAVEEADIPF
ncbi:MAG: single-stranded DNA-binding protein [Candidatus Acidiferrales bacterium]